MGPERRSAMIDRREFLAVLATAVAALGTRETIAGSPHAQRDVLPVADLGSLQKAYTFFNPTEAEFIEARSEEHTSELQSRLHLVCRLLLEKKKNKRTYILS